MFEWWRDTILGGIAYDLLRWLAGSLTVSLLATGILRVAFHKLKQTREVAVFSVGSFLVCLVLFYLIGTRPQEPNLVGAVQSIFSGASPANDRDTVAIFTIGIVNTGGMQSIVKGWNVEASYNRVKYQGVFAPMPKTFTFNNIPRINEEQPDSVSFKSEDNIIEKGLFPVQSGAFLQGIIFVLFRNVDPNIFKGVVDYSISYEDVFSKKYSMPIKSTGQIGLVGLTPGLHTEAVCRGPSWPPTTTGSTPSPSAPLNYTPLLKKLN
jgi:hypothetical protein